MTDSWTFGQKIGAGFAAVVLLTLVVGGIGVYALRQVVEAKDHVIEVNAQNLSDAQQLRSSGELKSAAARGFLLTGEQRFLDNITTARTEFSTTLQRVRERVHAEESRRLVEDIARAEADHQKELDAVLALRPREPSVDAVSRNFEDKVVPKRDLLSNALGSFLSVERRLLSEGEKAATERASVATNLVMVVVLAALVLAAFAALVITRALSRQIGSAVQHVQSSSAELQASANQQASGTREQATAMNEITTTITELLATAKQIADSAQRVAQIAEETARAARSGDQMVQKTNDSIAGIRRQVDVIVTHMLDLGKKSQQIGGILEIINELAEQTNILAINASIEAAGAGETGRRFGVVADEIRKLADRVAISTKDVRALIDDIRAAVNTTVMATEGGTKAVDAGARQFSDVATAFGQIASLVSTTTEAAREIELSTKQQSTAVEQVNIAVANVAQATKETEASSSQTLQTASQLAGLSRDLLKVIQSHASA